MKYIRTEDGIYEDAGTDALGLRCVRYKGNKIALSQDDDKIVKEADTIEELCDMFVVVDNERHIPLSNVEDTNEEWLKRVFHVSNNYVVYGAIWTEKGLIYVAKMNDKGELEVL